MDCERIEAVDGDLAFLVADIAYGDDGGDALTGDKGKSAIFICEDLMCSSFEVNGGAHEWVAVLVRDSTGEGNVVGVRRLGEYAK